MFCSLDEGTLAHFLLVEGYLWDWLIAGIAILVNLLVPAGAVKPINRYYTQGDPALSYPSEDSSVPSWLLYILIFVLPAVVFGITCAVKRGCGLVDWHHAALSIAEGFALSTGFKRWMNLVGRLRPNWLATLATNDDDEIADARLAYPSGHSAYIFFAMTIMSLYLVGKTELLSRPGQLLFAKACLALAPIALATFVAVSRIADYKHDPSDVNAGCFIGFMCGTFVYFLNYPSLFALDAPYPKRRVEARQQVVLQPNLLQHQQQVVVVDGHRSSGGGGLAVGSAPGGSPGGTGVALLGTRPSNGARKRSVAEEELHGYGAGTNGARNV